MAKNKKRSRAQAISSSVGEPSRIFERSFKEIRAVATDS